VNVWFWSWIVLVVVFALGEALTGGFFVLPWALGAAVAALLDALHVSIGWQWLAFFTISTILLIAIQRYRRRR
jgi:membrane protein implicated in regulation of membrane protease activity